jgi:hypothetical protein
MIVIVIDQTLPTDYLEPASTQCLFLDPFSFIVAHYKVYNRFKPTSYYYPFQEQEELSTAFRIVSLVCLFVRMCVMHAYFLLHVVSTNLEESEHGDGADDQSDRGGLGHAGIDGLLGGSGGLSAAGSHGRGAVACWVRSCWYCGDGCDRAGLKSRRGRSDGCSRALRCWCRRC